MFLQLLNINKFIDENKLMEVKSYRIPSKTYDEDGLWSEVIFGPIGSKTRSERFGYVDLKRTFIHPTVFDMITTVSDETSKIVRDKGGFIVENKKYVEDAAGETGIDFLIRTAKDVNYKLFCHKHKVDHAKYLEEYKSHILIDKFLVQPAFNRDIDIYNKKSRMVIDEINDYYSKLIIYISQLTGIDEIDNITIRKIQLQLNAIVDFIKKDKMTGKKGLFKGTMLRKSLDYSSRLVLTNSPDIELGTVGLPWHTLVALFEPFVIYHLFKKSENESIIKLLETYTANENFDQHSFNKFTKDIITNPEVVPNEVKNGIISILHQFLDNQIVMCKRDPVVQRKSWFAAKPIITEGRVAYVNSVDLGPIGGDCLKGNVITYTKNENGGFVKNVESIDYFYKNHKLEFIESRITGNIQVYDFLVLDDIYSIGINENTETIEYCKIDRWSIHTNLNLYNMIVHDKETDTTSTIIISETNSCYVYNAGMNKCIFEKLSVKEVMDDYLLFFTKLNYFSNKSISYIPNTNVKFTPYENKNQVTINIGNLHLNIQDDKIAYDFTIADDGIRSFLHESNIFQCNSDGDTLAIIPIFTNEAKEEVNAKMNPLNNKSKWRDLASYNELIYGPSLDAVATIYNATKL